jgi:3-oxoacid CoA-transferase subunit A
MKKLISKNELLDYIHDGDTLLVGGFGLSGTPLTILDRIAESPLKELTVISNNLGEEKKGLGKLLEKRQLKKAIGSYFTTNRDAVREWSQGKLEIELIPQGTLAEAIRCGGAGLGGFYTKTAVGTQLAINKEEKEIDGEKYIFEKAIKGDVSLIKATKADILGNLVYEHTSRNFNAVMATAGKIVIAEVDEIVETGTFSPSEIVTPHVYVDFIVKSDYVKKGGKYLESCQSN